MPYLSDPDVTLHCGDALEVLRTLPARSVHMCACGCGTEIQNPDSRGRPRRFARGHNLRIDHPLHRPGVENWWTGRTHTPEARAKIAAKAAGPKPNLRGKRNGMSGRTGSRNPNWKGGVAPERQLLYASGEWRKVVRTVKRRDGGCVECNSAYELHVHHIESFADFPLLRLEPGNLETLCRSCHYAKHSRRGVRQ